MTAGSRPAGAPFWGESLRVNSGIDYAGAALGTEFYEAPLVTRGRYGADTDHVVASAGDAFNVFIDDRCAYLLPGDDAVVQWVLEVADGSGTVSLRDGIAASYDTVPTLPPNDQGTVEVTGPGTYTWAATVTVAQLTATSGFGSSVRPVALITVVSGSVSVQQVKLRVWPPDGPLGSQSGSGPAATSQTRAAQVTTASWSARGEGVNTDANAAWQAAWLQHDGLAAGHPAVGEAIGSWGNTTANLGGAYEASVGTDFNDNYSASATTSATSCWVSRTSDDDLLLSRTPPGMDGVDWIRDPNEVSIDPVAYCQPTEPIIVDWDVVQQQDVGGDPDPFKVLDTSVDVQYVETARVGSTYPAALRTIYSTTLFDSNDATPGTYTHFIPVPGDVQRFQAQGIHEFHNGGAPAEIVGYSSLGSIQAKGSAGAQLISSTGGSKPAYSYVLPAYRYWTPQDAPARLPLRQRQRDDGLGLSTARWRAGRSVQASNRWRGYR